MHKQNPGINVNRMSAAPEKYSIIIRYQSYTWHTWDRFAAIYEYSSNTMYVRQAELAD